MNKYNLIYLAFSLCLISCADRETKNKEKAFEITISAIIEKNDNLELFYMNTENQSNFSEKRKIRKKIIGNNKHQEIKYKLPLEAFPLKIRLDFGNNIEQESISIRKITFKKGNKEFELNGTDLKWFFTTNKYLENVGNGTFKFRSIKDARDPFIISKAILLKKLEIEL